MLCIHMVLGLLNCLCESLLVLRLHLENLVVKLLLLLRAGLIGILALLFQLLISVAQTAVKLLNFIIKLLLHIPQVPFAALLALSQLRSVHAFEFSNLTGELLIKLSLNALHLLAHLLLVLLLDLLDLDIVALLEVFLSLGQFLSKLAFQLLHLPLVLRVPGRLDL